MALLVQTPDPSSVLPGPGQGPHRCQSPNIGCTIYEKSEKCCIIVSFGASASHSVPNLRVRVG
jgi:hypothetical protein